MAALEITPDALLSEAGQLALENRMLLRRISDLENEVARLAGLLGEARAAQSRGVSDDGAVSDPAAGA